MLVVAGWIVVGLLFIVSVSHVAHVHGNAVVAVAQDILPIVLILAWVVVPLALLAERGWLAATSGVLIGYHLALIVPRLRRTALPHWVERAPRLVLGVANVYVGNRTPDAAALQLVQSGADVLVVLETTPAFRDAFDRVGGQVAYPHHVFDPDDGSSYAVSIYARLRPQAMGMVSLGDLRAASVVVPCETTALHVLGVIPTAVVEAGGYRAWRRQISAIAQHVPLVHEPMVVAGDLNTTTFRPGIDELLAAGLVDAHESLGRGLKASFKLAANGCLGRIGPFVRLDHTLLNRRVRALDVRDLLPAGSDHHPFLVTLAVRPTRAEWSLHPAPAHPSPSPASL